MPSHARRVCVHMPKTRCRVDGEDQDKLSGSNQASTPAAIRGQTISSSPSRLSWWRGRVSRQVGSMRSLTVRVTCPCRMQRWMFASSIRMLRSSAGSVRLLDESDLGFGVLKLAGANSADPENKLNLSPPPLILPYGTSKSPRWPRGGLCRGWNTLIQS